MVITYLHRWDMMTAVTHTTPLYPSSCMNLLVREVCSVAVKIRRDVSTVSCAERRETSRARRVSLSFASCCSLVSVSSRAGTMSGCSSVSRPCSTVQLSCSEMICSHLGQYNTHIRGASWGIHKHPLFLWNLLVWRCNYSWYSLKPSELHRSIFACAFLPWEFGCIYLHNV